MTIGASKGGGGMVTTMNAAGKELVGLGVATTGEGMVTASDPTGRYGFGRLEPRR